MFGQYAYGSIAQSEINLKLCIYKKIN